MTKEEILKHLVASNPDNQESIVLSDKGGCDCCFEQFGIYIKIIGCRLCGGDDEYTSGEHCPVCEYCCGC